MNEPTTPATSFQGGLHTTMGGNHGVCASVTFHNYLPLALGGVGSLSHADVYFWMRQHSTFPDGCNAVPRISRHGSTVYNRAVRAVSSRSLDCE